MKINQQKFFGEATLRICGSLSIEKALHDLFLYLSQFFPIDMAILTWTRQDDVIELIASANREGGKMEGGTALLPISVLQHLRTGVFIPVEAITKVGEHPIFKHVGFFRERGFDNESMSLIFLRLILDEKRIAALTLISSESEAYSKADVNLLSCINEPCAIALSNYLRFRELNILKDNLHNENRYLQHRLKSLSDSKIIGEKGGLKPVMDQIQLVAPLSTPVLLIGETGVGKELIADAICNLSLRAQAPFIKVNCAAITPSLLDSELFGYERGAFTGAHSRKLGWFELAHTGTIFLDEIGELTIDVQVRLLRVLQEKEILRVGGSKQVKLDIRIIAATHQNLEQLVHEKKFREDLFYRLNVFPIKIPPLRAHPEDIPALVHYFVQKKSSEINLSAAPDLPSGTMERLQKYSWPGNIRELENVVERAVILSRGKPIHVNALPLHLGEHTKHFGFENGRLGLDQLNARHIQEVLRMTRGRIEGRGGAAELLEVNSATLRNRLRKLQIPFGRKADYGSEFD